MGIILSLIFVTFILISVGIICATPIYLSIVKNTVRHTKTRRQLTVAVMGTLTFIICFVGVAYLDAKITKTFSEVVADIDNPFIENSPQDKALVRELWLQNIVLPSAREDCYMPDVAVCAVSNQIEDSLAMSNTTEYLILLAHALIATMSNMILVNYILRDTRKKHINLVTG